MKILCLHGGGTSGSIMEFQFADLCAQLDDAYEYVFLDGEIEAPKAVDLTEDFEGPYFDYYSGLNHDELKDACELLDSVIQEEGPFDGFFAFSQGSSLAISYLVHQEITQPNKPYPFKWGVCVSSMVAFSPDKRYMDKELAEFDKKNGKPTFGDSKNAVRHKLPEHRIGLLTKNGKKALGQELVDLVKCSMDMARQMGRGTKEMDDLDADVEKGTKTVADFPRLYHPLTTPQRLSLPTVHVIGSRDYASVIKQAETVRRLCDPAQCTLVEHTGGHDVPRNPHEQGALVAAISKVIEDSRFLAPRL